MCKKRMAVGIEYEGTQYHGWQIQKNASSIQETVENALSKIANEPITIVGSGRTDTGVHALGQVAHFDTSSVRCDEAWIIGSNTFLPKDIRIQWIKPVASTFNARRSAKARSYRYVIYSNRISPGLHRNAVTWVYDALDVSDMAKAAQYFIGEHDFSSFRASGCQAKTPFRRMTDMTVRQHHGCIFLEVTGNAFLHHMVRNFAGVLIEIGRGRKPVTWANEVLLARDRRYAGITAPASGLYLMSIDYPPEWGLPKGPASTWFFE